MIIRLYLNADATETDQRDIQQIIERLTNQRVCVRVVTEQTGIGYADK